MNTTEVEFKKKLIWFSQEEYNNAVKLSRQKLRLLAECVEWASKHIADIHIEMFVEDGMLEHFLDKLKYNKPELQKLGITKPEKIADLLGIELKELISLENKFNKCEGKIRFVKGKAMEDVNEEQFKRYTKDEEENKRYAAASRIVKALVDAEKDGYQINRNYVHDATRGLVHYYPYEPRGFRYNYQWFSR